jgi:methylase of polypeptide subunit release factors
LLTISVHCKQRLILSNRPRKEIHDWEQSTIEAKHVLKRLTVENQIVFDPFMGMGTTAVAAQNLKRKFVGIDIDPYALSRAGANIERSFSNIPSS